MNDDIDDDNLDLDEAGFDDFENQQSTLGDLWRNNPVIKIGVVGAAVVAILGTIMLFGGEDQVVDQSYIPAGSEIKAPPGTEEATPAYIAAVEEENETRIESAFREGGSALPTPIDPPVGRLQIPEEEKEAEDPLQRWHQLQEKRIQMEIQNTESQSVLNTLPEDTSRSDSIQALAAAMSDQMSIMLEEKSTISVKSKTITDPNFRKAATKTASGSGGAGAADASGQEESAFFEDQDLENFGTVILPAAEIAYAQLLTEANSDVPGPILAQIVSGPLAGSRIIGEFSVENELLILNFGTVIKDGESIPVNAVALDPATTLPGLATDVDHRYLQRVVFPMAAAFVEGMASAISESGRTTVTIQGETVAEETEETDNKQEVATGIEEAGQELREILDDLGEDVETLVRIEAGTPIGILFLESVIEGANG